ncbi:MAG TPA: bifunctional isocitrate dehydrogenase kinase/phosphatase [Thermoanaerobaculaceae bacterium]|nr:bifunctional isocitrate dehydrogenase kinase/phosphatase [Thermoanaerobaculaceae bacterium]
MRAKHAPVAERHGGSGETPADQFSLDAAAKIRDGFDTYTNEFASITKRSKWRFQTRDWKGRHEDALERLDLYEKVLREVADAVAGKPGENVRDETLWASVKEQFARSIQGRHDVELAETFFNSVTRRIFGTVGINRRTEFFHWNPRPVEDAQGEPIFNRYEGGRDTRQLIRDILRDYKFTVPYEDPERDADLVGGEIDLYLWPLLGPTGEYRIEVIRSPFYRNKVAYLVGRIVAVDRVIPLVLPLYNGDAGVFVDTVLLAEAEVSKVFSFAFSYFHVLVERHDLLIEFLRSILPEKPLAELYISIGYNRHGKTEFYRDLHRFIHRSKERFVIAPGKEGAVMTVFTLPAYSYVFKVIKDRPCFLRSAAMTDKTSTRREVMDQYALVCRRDRVGRLVDTQEFENLRFRRERFDRQLLAELRQAAQDIVSLKDDHVVIRHLYVQRKVIPLPMFMAEERDPEALRRTILDFGYFLKDLAATGIFPSDLFNTWNYGVTRRGRVVLFDYDDVIPIEQASFSRKPRTYDESEEFVPEEDRIVATANDFFIDEMRSYSGIPQRLKGVFELVHGDLFTVDFWRSVKEQVSAGELVDITPYDRAMKFRRP